MSHEFSSKAESMEAFFQQCTMRRNVLTKPEFRQTCTVGLHIAYTGPNLLATNTSLSPGKIAIPRPRFFAIF